MSKDGKETKDTRYYQDARESGCLVNFRAAQFLDNGRRDLLIIRGLI